MEKQSEDLYLFFRQSCIALQSRFSELFPLGGVPHVFLHGNPHIDNYAKTNGGEAMIDFDRSRFGPYAWDIVRLLTSVSLRREEVGEQLVDGSVIDAFTEGYVGGFQRPELDFDLPLLLEDVLPEEYQLSTRSYLRANKKWAKQLSQKPIFPSHPIVQSLVKLYFEGRYQSGAHEDYQILKAGMANGSLGKPRVLVVLENLKDPDEDLILLDLKEVYRDPDTKYFFNPYIHHGLRMIEASHLYAPGIEEMMSWINWQGCEYWGRRIPSFKGKIKDNLNVMQQENFVFRVGAQLGSGHRRSLRVLPPNHLLKHLHENLTLLVKVGEQMNRELQENWGKSQISKKTSASHKFSKSKTLEQ